MISLFPVAFAGELDVPGDDLRLVVLLSVTPMASRSKANWSYLSTKIFGVTPTLGIIPPVASLWPRA